MWLHHRAAEVQLLVSPPLDSGSISCSSYTLLKMLVLASVWWVWENSGWHSAGHTVWWASILETSVPSFIGLMMIKFRMLLATASFGIYLSKKLFFNPLAFPGKALWPFKVKSYNSLQHIWDMS